MEEGRGRMEEGEHWTGEQAQRGDGGAAARLKIRLAMKLKMRRRIVRGGGQMMEGKRR